eukprot:237396-Chlamydomonas_euryale.AAC.3
MEDGEEITIDPRLAAIVERMLDRCACARALPSVPRPPRPATVEGHAAPQRHARQPRVVRLRQPWAGLPTSSVLSGWLSCACVLESKSGVHACIPAAHGWTRWWPGLTVLAAAC